MTSSCPASFLEFGLVISMTCPSCSGRAAFGPAIGGAERGEASLSAVPYA